MIRIYTDASFCHVTKTSGWAYMIQNGRTIHGSGFVTEVETIYEAELIAIQMAVFGLCLSTIDEDTNILFHCDNLGVCNMLTNREKEYQNKKLGGVRETLNNFLSNFYVNYVPRNSIQPMQWCDKNAKEQLRQKRYD